MATFTENGVIWDYVDLFDTGFWAVYVAREIELATSIPGGIVLHDQLRRWQGMLLGDELAIVAFTIYRMHHGLHTGEWKTERDPFIETSDEELQSMQKWFMEVLRKIDSGEAKPEEIFSDGSLVQDYIKFTNEGSNKDVQVINVGPDKKQIDRSRQMPKRVHRAVKKRRR